MKNIYLYNTALALITLCSLPSLAVAEKANNTSCKDNTVCEAPEHVGKLALDSASEVRSTNKTAPNIEYRNTADEVLVLFQPKKPTQINTAQKADYFASGVHTLTEEEKETLDTFVARIESSEIHAIRITGHADEQPFKQNAHTPYSNNKELSLARAQQTADYLRTALKNVNTSIEVIGKGSDHPVVTCDEHTVGSKTYKDCLAPNRRIEIKVWYKEKPAPVIACKDRQPSTTDLPFRISIDGNPLQAGDTSNSADVTRCKDVALEKANIQVRFDPLENTQALNITAYPQNVVRGEVISFTPYSNYSYYIHKAEVRIFEEGVSTQKEPLAIVDLNTTLEKEARWQAPLGSDQRKLQYLLRVYDDKGRFDETEIMSLHLLDKSRPLDDQDNEEREKLVGYGENHLALKNIPVSGGIVTINGDNVPKGTQVKTMGAHVPVDANGRFAYRQILPAGNHTVEIETLSPNGTKAEFTRSLYIPNQDWFYIGLADLTLGKNNVNGPAKLVTGDNSKRYDGDTYVDGRLAFYAKGKVKGVWLLSASADTKEQPVEDLFSNFTSKNPRNLLKRIDPNKYYQVYGDDSTTIEDAPTQGKFYVKLEKEESHVMWGNFQTKITGTDLLNHSRTLYGANAEYVSPEVTTYGENKTEANAYAADPGSVSSLEEHRGTGGSLYYLRGQDVVVGSEQLRIEIRDRDSDIVLSTQYLTYGQDYEVNYTQGRIILREALSSTSTNNTIVQTGSLSGNPVYLVAGYEFTPSASEINNLSKGGRVSHWVNDNLRVGVTAYDQDGSGLDQTLTGADIIARYKPGTYIKLETARSRGAGNGSLSSADGGFSFSDIDQTKTDDIESDAYRAEIAVDLAEVTDGKHEGTISAYTLNREDGFSAPGQLTSEDILQHGLSASIPITDDTTLGAKADYKSGSETGDITSVEILASHQLTSEKEVTLAVRHDDRNITNSAGGNSEELSETGERTDIALKYLYAPLTEEGEKKRYEVYSLVQGTLNKTESRDRNNRIGAGGRYDVNDRVGLTAEATTGNQGWGGQVGVEYTHSDRTSYYANYLIDTDRSDIGARGRSSNLTVGAKSRYSDSISVFAEERHQTFDNDSSSLIHSFGLDLAASDEWTWGGRFENGTISDTSSGDIERTAISLSSGYHNYKTKYAGTVELRLEDGGTGGDRTSWLVSNNLSYQVIPDWRMLADLDFAISESGLSSNLDADFIELGLGYAYRPVDNDRLNALLRYEYLQDLASPGQLDGSASNAANDYEQRSHVFSVDTIYDLTPKWAIGGKVGYRFGEIRDTTIEGSDFFDSQALLLIGRADWHVVKKWDLTGELRYLEVSEAKDSKTGALLGAYRHFNQHIKAGVGYNFTDFSDDLTDLDYESKGPFVNVVGKF
ncbi:MAG: OmpA family protein [Alphaproteobacteria bacterium]